MSLFFDYYREHSQQFYNAQLVLAMLGMGATSTVQQFRDVFRRPTYIALVMVLQFVFMPLFAVLYVKASGLDPAIGVGLVLLMALPSGTLSNIITFMGRGNVPLSVTATCASTVLCLVVTPIVLQVFAAQQMPDGFQMPLDKTVVSIVLLLLLPLSAGMAAGHIWPNWRERLAKLAVWGSTIALIGVWVGAIGGGQIKILQYGWQTPALLIGFVVLTLLLTYWVTLALRYAQADAFTLGVEVSMRNANLGLALLVPLFGVLTPENTMHQGALYTVLFGGGSMLVVGMMAVIRRHARFARQRRAGLEEV